MHFVHEVSEIASKELAFRAKALDLKPEDLELGVTGLSLGGSMASYAATSRPERFTRQLLLNPFFGVGQEDVDANLKSCLRQVKKGNATKTDCMLQMFEGWVGSSVKMPPAVTWILREAFGQGTVAGVQRPLLSTLAKMSDAAPGERSSSIQAPFRQFMDMPEMWYEICVKITNYSRGGFCTFKREHLLAANSFGLHALVQARNFKSSKLPVMQLIMTERDGITRNGLAYVAAQHHHEVAQQLMDPAPDTRTPDASACMYRFSKGTNHDDREQWGPDHVMSHANTAHVDNPGINRWWEKKYFRNIAGFLSGQVDRLSDEHVTGDKNECVDIPLKRDSLKSKATPWLRKVVSPEAAPKTEKELKPDVLWRSTVLNFDYWARHVGCPFFTSSLKGVVDCSIFANATERKPLSAWWPQPLSAWWPLSKNSAPRDQSKNQSE